MPSRDCRFTLLYTRRGRVCVLTVFNALVCIRYFANLFLFEKQRVCSHTVAGRAVEQDTCSIKAGETCIKLYSS